MELALGLLEMPLAHKKTAVEAALTLMLPLARSHKSAHSRLLFSP